MYYIQWTGLKSDLDKKQTTDSKQTRKKQDRSYMHDLHIQNKMCKSDPSNVYNSF